jgi:hypothetical protein
MVLEKHEIKHFEKKLKKISTFWNNECLMIKESICIYKLLYYKVYPPPIKGSRDATDQNVSYLIIKMSNKGLKDIFQRSYKDISNTIVLLEADDWLVSFAQKELQSRNTIISSILHNIIINATKLWFFFICNIYVCNFIGDSLSGAYIHSLVTSVHLNRRRISIRHYK